MLPSLINLVDIFPEETVDVPLPFPRRRTDPPIRRGTASCIPPDYLSVCLLQ